MTSCNLLLVVLEEGYLCKFTPLPLEDYLILQTKLKPYGVCQLFDCSHYVKMWCSLCVSFWLRSPVLTLPGDVCSIPTFTKTRPLKAEHDGGFCLLPVCFQWRAMIRPFQLGVVLQDVHHQMSHNLDLSICTWRCREELWEKSHQVKKVGRKRLGHRLARWPEGTHLSHPVLHPVLRHHNTKFIAWSIHLNVSESRLFWKIKLR